MLTLQTGHTRVAYYFLTQRTFDRDCQEHQHIDICILSHDNKEISTLWIKNQDER